MPDPDTPAPPQIVTIAGGRPIRAVWRNELEGLTFQVGTGATRLFAKWAPSGSGIHLAGEAERIEWAGRYVAVPDVVDVGRDPDGEWLVTTGLPGESAVGERWRSNPAAATTAIGVGLRTLHDALPATTCPFSWSTTDRVALAHRRAAAGEIDPSQWHPDHESLSLRDALAVLDDPPPDDRLVVCHGDTCAPNTIVADDGSVSGHVDLGALGVADRWADLAVATWSTTWNYGTGWERAVLDAYGIEWDGARVRYYRLLWDLGP